MNYVCKIGTMSATDTVKFYKKELMKRFSTTLTMNFSKNRIEQLCIIYAAMRINEKMTLDEFGDFIYNVTPKQIDDIIFSMM